MKIVILNPPLLIGSRLYNLALDLRPANYTNSQITTGKIRQIIDLGNNIYRLVFEHKPVPFSYIFERQELSYTCMCGGGVVDHPEPYRFYNWLNETGVRGNISHIRSKVLDAVNPGGGLIVNQQAFGIPPASVNYTNPDQDNDVRKVMLDFPVIAPILTPYFAFDDSLDNIGIFRGGSKLTRKIFDSDEYKYPAGATLASNEYWLNPVDKSVQVSSSNPETQLFYVWNEEGWEQYARNPLGLLTHGDEGRLYTISRGNFGRAILVVNANSTFTWFIEYSDLKYVKVEMNNGTIERIAYRNGGSEIEPAFNGTTFSDTFYTLRMNRVGISDTQVRVTISAFSDTVPEFEVCEITLTLVPNASGIYGVATNDGEEARFFTFDANERMINEGGFARQSRFLEYQVKLYDDYNVGSFQTINGVRYGTYSLGIGVARYSDLGNGVIRFHCETAPDYITLTYNTKTPNNPPGRAPRVTPGVINFATADNNGIATTSVDENVANWYDYVDVYTRDMRYVVGQTVSIERNAVIDERQPVRVFAAMKNSSDFQIIDPSNYIVRGVEGIILIDQNVPTGTCWRVEATFIEHDGPLQAKMHNNLKSALRASPFVESPFNGPGGRAMSGRVSPKWFVPAGFTALGSPTSMLVGQTYERWIIDPDWSFFGPAGPWTDRLAFAGVSPPYWHGNGIYIDADSDGWTKTSAWGNQFIFSDPGPRNRDLGVAGSWIAIGPYDPTVGGILSGNYLGVDIDTLGSLIPDIGQARMRFQSIPLGLPDAIKRMPKGTKILSAKLEAKFDQLKSVSWSFEASGEAINGRLARNYSGSISVNGNVVRQGVVVNGVETTLVSLPWSEIDGADVGYVVVGRRLKDESVYYPLLGTLADYLESLGGVVTPEDRERWAAQAYDNIPAHEYVMLGSALVNPSPAGDNQKIIDVKNVVQALLDNGVYSDFADFELWPSIGPAADIDVNGLAQYVKAADWNGTVSYTLINDAEKLGSMSIQGSGKYIRWEGVTLGKFIFQYELPSQLPNVNPPIPIPRGGV